MRRTGEALEATERKGCRIVNKPGSKYFELFEHFPLVPIRDDIDYVAGEDLIAVLRARESQGTLHEDEAAFMEVLELLVMDYDNEEFALSGDEICEECGEPISEHEGVVIEEEEVTPEDFVEDLEAILRDQKEKLQEWDFVALCQNMQSVISSKLSELESE